MIFSLPFVVNGMQDIAHVEYDPFYSIDTVKVMFPTATWHVLIDFFETSNDWGGDFASIVAADAVIFVLRDLTDGGRATNVALHKLDVQALLNNIALCIESFDIVIPLQRERQVESFLSTL